MKKQSGFAAIELVLVLVIVAAIAGVGYYATKSHSQATQPAVATTSQPAPVTTPVAPQINTASDLNTAMQALNQTQIGASNTDSSQLNSQMSAF